MDGTPMRPIHRDIRRPPSLPSILADAIGRKRRGGIGEPCTSARAARASTRAALSALVLARDVHQLKLQAVGVGEKDRVVTRLVAVIGGWIQDLYAALE